MKLTTQLLALTAGLATSSGFAASTLIGFAKLPADTFSPGPTSGQYATFNNALTTLPLVNQQPVQGFSAVLTGPSDGTYYVMPDNGFGAKGNSPDALLRVYAVKPDFRTASGGTGTVSPVHYSTGVTQATYNASTYISLRDPDQKITFSTIASLTNYPGTPSANAQAVIGTTTIPVDATIKSGRLLTGADFDIESMRKDSAGNLWFGDEFGPYLIKTDATGKVLRSEIPLPGVKSPNNPTLGGATANLGNSSGFEGMAINATGNKLLTLLEGTVAGDTPKTLRINTFDLATESYEAGVKFYALEASGTNIGDMTAVNGSDTKFLVIERNGVTATSVSGTPFKKVFLIDTSVVDANGVVQKTELIDLMNIADPFDLNADGSTLFTFPYVTIEDILPLSDSTFLIINDNNYPGNGGRNLSSDTNEFLLVSTASAIPEPSTYALLFGALALAVVGSRRARR